MKISMNKNTIVLTVISVIAIFGFLTVAYILTNKPPTPTEVPEIATLKTVEAGDHTKWSPAKKHVLIEYSDLQCPACKSFHDYMKANVDTDKEITDSITFVYRHFPLTQIHKNAYRAALAAEAASKQNKFYQFTDVMFAKQKEWEGSGDPIPQFMQYAKSVGINTDQLKKDMDSKEVADAVKADVSSGEGYTVDSTPTFFLDGKRLVDLGTYEDFKARLKAVVKK